MKTYLIAAGVAAALLGSGAQAATIASTYDTSAYNHAGSYGYVNGGYAGTSTYNDIARDYLQFSLSSLGAGQSVTSATLNLNYCCAYEGNGTLGLYATSDAWDGATLSWTNQPGLGDLLTTFAPVAFGLYTLDVTDFVAAQYATDGIVSFVLADANGGNSWRYFNGGTQTLSVETAATAVPEPAMLGLMGLGFLGIAAGRRRKPRA